MSESSVHIALVRPWLSNREGLPTGSGRHSGLSLALEFRQVLPSPGRHGRADTRESAGACRCQLQHWPDSRLPSAGVARRRGPVHRMAAYADVAKTTLPVTDDVYDRILCLPLFHELADADVDHICDLIRCELSRSTRRNG